MSRVFLVITASNLDGIKSDATIHTAAKDAQRSLWESANESVKQFIASVIQNGFSKDAVDVKIDSTGYEFTADAETGMTFCKGRLEQRELDLPSGKAE